MAPDENRRATATLLIGVGVPLLTAWRAVSCGPPTEDEVVVVAGGKGRSDTGRFGMATLLI